MDNLIASLDLLASLRRVIDEQQQSDHLQAHGFDPAYRLLLTGPPGTGKTMTAAVLAYELDLPLFTVRPDTLFSGYMGKTAKKLQQVFDVVASHRAVYLFDEFDALGAGGIADGGSDVGEARRIVNSLLMFIESVAPVSVVIAATNHPTILDRAMFRRFDLRINYTLPTKVQAIALLADRLGGLSQEIAWSQVGQKLTNPPADKLSQAELVKAAEPAAKTALLNCGGDVSTSALIETLTARAAALPPHQLDMFEHEPT